MAVQPLTRILLPDSTPVESLDAYLARGGGAAFARAQQLGPDAVIAELRRAGLRGRGGAGFPTATKWAGVHNDPATTRYVCANGAEGEPGTFKDRYLLRMNPYQVIEGLAIARFALSARTAYLCTKRQFEPEVAALERALAELRERTTLVGAIELVLGPDEYLFGEEKALLEVIEGGLPLPRVFPPRLHGLFSGAYGGPSDTLAHPTVVNNVETLAHVTQILRNGADWFRGIGSADTPGTMIFTISGDVQRPQIVELPLGQTLGYLLFELAGGPAPGRRLKAVLPGAGAVLTPPQWDTPLSFDSMRAAGSGLGSGGFVAYDDSACMVQVLYAFSRFLYVESCNQCPPCKTGSRWITERLERLLAGEAEAHDLDEIHAASTWVTNAARCFLASEEAIVTAAMLAAFPEEFQAHLERRCALRHEIAIPKMTAYLPEGGFRFDENYVHKQPDWSYGAR
ncbi:MAG TPA: NADH-ubiquinone oxidoreductase-F iron-sulfur binding region domain-containing protein [Dehalococcoidia bacterium]|nr:NADH-ubiquinone oxidoreductase-F iron-sulfur binding region domain-containing protein [Dehalococcoidia bacterium]